MFPTLLKGLFSMCHGGFKVFPSLQHSSEGISKKHIFEWRATLNYCFFPGRSALHHFLVRLELRSSEETHKGLCKHLQGGDGAYG